MVIYIRTSRLAGLARSDFETRKSATSSFAPPVKREPRDALRAIDEAPSLGLSQIVLIEDHIPGVDHLCQDLVHVFHETILMPKHKHLNVLRVREHCRQPHGGALCLLYALGLLHAHRFASQLYVLAVVAKVPNRVMSFASLS